MEAKQKELMFLKESMVANKIPVQEIDVRLAEIARVLSGAAAPPPPALTPLECLNERSVTEKAAEAHRDAMEKKCNLLRSRLEVAQENATAAELALQNAIASLSDAVVAREAAAAACVATAPVAPAMPAQETCRETLRCAVDARFVQEVNALSSPGAEESIQLEMQAYADLWGCTKETLPMARYMAERAAAMRKEVTGGAPMKPADTTTSVAQVPPARPAAAPTEGSAEGESRIQPRVSTKEGDRLPAQAHASPSQEAKTTCAEVRRASLRKDAIESARALEDFELQEKEDAEDLTRLQEATDKAA